MDIQDIPLPLVDELKERLTTAPDPFNTGCFVVGWTFDDPERGKQRILELLKILENAHE